MVGYFAGRSPALSAAEDVLAEAAAVPSMEPSSAAHAKLAARRVVTASEFAFAALLAASASSAFALSALLSAASAALAAAAALVAEDTERDAFSAGAAAAGAAAAGGRRGEARPPREDRGPGSAAEDRALARGRGLCGIRPPVLG